MPSIYFVAFLVGARIGRELGLNQTACDLLALFAATVATLHLLSRQLPLQNIVGLSLIIALFSGATVMAAHFLSEPLIRPGMNSRFAELPHWTTPLLWLVALVNSRGIARLLLRGVPKTNYGLWLIGVSSLLAASLNFTTGTTGRTFVLQFALAAIALIVATPWLIDKRNVPPARSYQPLGILVLLLIW